MAQRALTPSTPGGLLDPNQTTLSANARRTMANLVAQGIAPNIARQLAIALNKSAVAKAAPCKGYHEAFTEAAKAILPKAMVNMLHVNARAIAGGHGKAARRAEAMMDVAKAEGQTPPQGVRSACKRGLELAPEHGGPGLTEGAKSRARSMAAGNAVSASQVKRMAAYFSRHQSDRKPGWSSPATPGYVAWMLWGGDAGKAWANAKTDTVSKAAHVLAVVKGNKPMGAAFAHARASGKKQDHESRKRRANAYLRSQGHEPIGKGGPGSGPHSGGDKKKVITNSKIKALQQQIAAKDSARLGLYQQAGEDLKGTSAEHERHAQIHEKLAQAHREIGNKRGEKRHAESAEKHKGLASQLRTLQKTAPLVQDVRAETFLRVVQGKKKKRKADQEPQATHKSVAVDVPATIIKTEQTDWQRLVWSVVYEPDTIDAHGDFMDAETIEKAAHNALREGIYVNSEHRGDPLPATVVESYIAPCDFTMQGLGGDTVVRKGTWVMGMHVTDDAAWNGVVDGTYRGFSLEGLAMAHAA